MKSELHKFSPAVQLVIRVLRPIDDYTTDLATLTTQLAEKMQVRS
jgi:hypothetical protein